MNKRFIIILALLVSSCGVFLYTQMRRAETTHTQNVASSTAVWTEYENTKYHYALSYPVGSRVIRTSEEEPVAENESLSIEISYGKSTVVVKADLPQATLPKYASVDSKYSKFVSLDLKSSAEYGRETEVTYLAEHKTTYNAGIHPSEVQSLIIGGRQAYGFSINGYSEASPLGGFEGVSLSGVNNYYVLQNDAGDKFVIAYPANDPIAQKIVDSFRFTDATSTR